MTYPFPGMNPYLEHKDVWHDFHNGLIERFRTALVPQTRPKYITKVDDNVYIHELTAEQRTLLGRPDVSISRGDHRSSHRPNPQATCEPMFEGTLIPTVDEVRESFIEIRDAEDRSLVTAIELLSPTNKTPGADREQYLAKRRCLLNSPANFVEIDLLRGGVRTQVEGLPQCDYAVMVSRYRDRPRVGLWSMRLKDRLPKIPIPLAGDDPDVVLDLQELVEAQFEAAGYEDYVYSHKPQPLLHPEDQTWADSLQIVASREN